MDVARFLLVNVALVSAAGAVGSWRHDGTGRRAWDWLALELVFAVVGALCWWRYPAAAPVVVSLFVGLVLVPIGGIYVALLLTSRWPRLAIIVAGVAYGLHPFGQTASHWKLLRAARDRARGHVDEDAAAQHPLTQHVLALVQAREDFDWEEIVRRCATPHPELSPAERLHGVLPLYLRALGELGQLDRMVAAAADGRAHLKDDDEARAFSALFVAAFTGRRDAVDALLAGPLAGRMSVGLARFWSATARMAAGLPTDDTWHALAASEEPRVAAAALQRLHRVRVVSPAPPDAVDALLTELTRDDPSARRWPAACLILCALLLGAHLVAELGDRRAWLERGAFWSPLVRDGEWWRLITGGLLHAGWLHLGLNLLGLWWYGRGVERALGPTRLVVTAIAGVLGGSLLTLGLVAVGAMDETAMIGASGGVMALVGATLAHAAARWRRGDRSAGESVRGALGWVALQVVSDLLTPQVSLAGHSGGLITGLALGLLFTPRSAGSGGGRTVKAPSGEGDVRSTRG